ncbi:MAG: hypothetical protein R3Y23_04695 [Bacillota bacterium]
MLNAILIIFGAVVLFIIGELLYWALLMPKDSKPNKKNGMLHYFRKDLAAYPNVYRHFMGLEVLDNAVVDNDYIYNAIALECKFVEHRFDCSDFRLQLMIRLYIDCKDQMEPRVVELIEKTFLDFKYFMDEKGADSMCYWSENHQILFATSEYLAGQTFKDRIFTNSGMTGREHMEKAEARIKAWIWQRFNFGFSEYYSNTYMLEDLGPMSNFIEYAENREMAEQMRMIMDLFWFDIATHSVKNRFMAVSSRMYANNKRGNMQGNSMLASQNLLWGEEMAEKLLSEANLCSNERILIEKALKVPTNDMGLNFVMLVKRGLYKLPDAIKGIALSDEDVVIKASSGLSPQDLVSEDLVGQEPHQIMAQLGAETFTNPEVVENTLSYLKHNKMFRNNFIFYFKFFNTTIPKMIGVNNIADKFKLRTHGIALSRGNVYTYKTKDYALTTAVGNSVDECGAQEHIWTANLGENLTIFTTHPAQDNKNFESSAGYWIGNGRRPMSAQKENVNITIYRIPTHKRVFEFLKANITHTYMPKECYDEFELCGDRVYARKGNTLVALIANGELKYRAYNPDSLKPMYKTKTARNIIPELLIKGEFDLVHEGKGGDYHAYITELSSLDKESFAAFKARIEATKIQFVGDKVVYDYRGSLLTLDYKGEFTDDGEIIDYNYDRFDSVYSKTERKAEEIVIKNGKKSVTLNLEKCTRTVVD